MTKPMILTIAICAVVHFASAQNTTQSSEDRIAEKVSGHEFTFKASPQQCSDVLYKEVATGVVKDAGGATPKSVRLAPKLYLFTCRCPSGDVISKPTMVGQATDYSFHCDVAVAKKEWRTEDEAGIPYHVTWQIDPTCTKFRSSDQTRRCNFTHTQTTILGDPTPYDHWHFELDAPGPVYDVTCLAGSHELSPPPYLSGLFEGQFHGQTAICEGYINGGDADVVMTVKWKQQR